MGCTTWNALTLEDASHKLSSHHLGKGAQPGVSACPPISPTTPQQADLPNPASGIRGCWFTRLGRTGAQTHRQYMQGSTTSWDLPSKDLSRGHVKAEEEVEILSSREAVEDGVSFFSRGGQIDRLTRIKPRRAE